MLLFYGMEVNTSLFSPVSCTFTLNKNLTVNFGFYTPLNCRESML